MKSFLEVQANIWPVYSSSSPHSYPPAFYILLQGKQQGKCYVHGRLSTQITVHFILYPISTRPMSVPWKKLFFLYCSIIGGIGFQSPFVFTANVRNAFGADFIDRTTRIFLSLSNQIKVNLTWVFQTYNS